MMYFRFSAPEGGKICDVARPFFAALRKTGYFQEDRAQEYGGMLLRHKDTGHEITLVLSNHSMDIEDRKDATEPYMVEANKIVNEEAKRQAIDRLADDAYESSEGFGDEDD